MEIKHYNSSEAFANIYSASIETKAKLLKADLIPGEGITYLLQNRGFAYLNRACIKALNEFELAQLKAPFETEIDHKILEILIAHLTTEDKTSLKLSMSIDEAEHPNVFSLRLNDPQAIGLDSVRGNFIWIKLTEESPSCFLDNFAAPDSPLPDGGSFKGYMAFKFTWALIRLMRKNNMHLGDGAVQVCPCNSKQNAMIQIRSLQQKSWYENQGAIPVMVESFFASCQDCLGISNEKLTQLNAENSSWSIHAYTAAKELFHSITVNDFMHFYSKLSTDIQSAQLITVCIDRIKKKTNICGTLSLHDVILKIKNSSPEAHELYHEFINRVFTQKDTFLLELTSKNFLFDKIFYSYVFNSLLNSIVAVNKSLFPDINKEIAQEIIIHLFKDPSSINIKFKEEYSLLVKKVAEFHLQMFYDAGNTCCANAKVASILTKNPTPAKLNFELTLNLDLDHFESALKTIFKHIPTDATKLKSLHRELNQNISDRFFSLANTFKNNPTNLSKFDFFEMLTFATLILDEAGVFKIEIDKSP